MDRARANAERANERAPPRFAQNAVAMALAVSIVLFVALGFDSFLSAFQHYLDASIEPPPPSPTEPLPVFAVEEAAAAAGAPGESAAQDSAAGGVSRP